MTFALKIQQLITEDHSRKLLGKGNQNNQISSFTYLVCVPMMILLIYFAGAHETE